MAALEEREAFKLEGYVVVDSLVGSLEVEQLKGIGSERREDLDMYILGNQLLLVDPGLILRIVAGERTLDILEDIMGPFVQLDSVALVGLPPRCSADISWHRDLYGSVPRGREFQRPLSINLLIYLQNLDHDVGPLRVIPGSHRKAMLMDDGVRAAPHEDERLVFAKAGQGVIVHNNLVHSRTRNRSSRDRMHLSVVYNLTCMRSTVDYLGQEFRAIVEQIEAIGDPRLSRLFGKDAYGEHRYNSGFLQDEEEIWRQWRRMELEARKMSDAELP